jgi:diguanylate cyclase (GGDEF)-like protein
MDPMFGPVDCWALRRNRVHEAGLDPSSPRCGHLLGMQNMHTVCVPLTAQGESLGVLVLVEPLAAAERAERELDADEQADRRRTLTATAEQIALALANLRLRDTLKSQSIRDPLTGLFNRRFLEESLERECRRSIRSSRPLSVMMLDIDHFKRFNDTFGHDAGDAVLREVGAVLRSFFRGEDVACRYGGEEFALVLTDTTSDGALARASQLREQVHQLSLSFRRQSLGPVTISVGIATLPLHATTAEALLRVADKALYRAKHEGRDRVILADAETTERALADTGLI